jgi:rfaE bifunctional protein kinase chain/domain
MSLTRSFLAAAGVRFAATRVTVVGDVMLDEYLYGEVHRISPEAPVPVLALTRREYRAGGAANAAANVACLSAQVALVGLIGDDAQAARLREILQRAAVDTSGLVVDPSRPTTCKTRIVARGQQVVRVDQESGAPPGPDLEARSLERVLAHLAQAHACVLSDYDKGMLTPSLLSAVIAEARRRGIPVIVDPKKRDFRCYRGATLLTPNLLELELATGTRAVSDAEVVASARTLLPAVEPAALLVTRGAAGMTLGRADEPPIHVPTAAKIVFDVTGAGDTIVSVLAAGLAAGLPFAPLLDLANQAAGLVVSRVGAASVTLDELAALLPS